jgi:hypothetical protein
MFINNYKTKMKKTIPKFKTIKNRTEKTCAVCGKKIKVIFYTDRSYRGGNYFGKIPISTKKEWARVMKFGTTSWKLGNKTMQVLKKDPKPYKYVEYWECDECYNEVVT